jgi:hypothetical protein
MNHQVGPVLFILAAPDQLRIEIAVAICFFFFVSGSATRQGYGQCVLRFLLQYRLKLGGGNVLALGFIVNERFYSLFAICCLLCHAVILLILSCLSGLCRVSLYLG